MSTFPTPPAFAELIKRLRVIIDASDAKANHMFLNIEGIVATLAYVGYSWGVLPVDNALVSCHGNLVRYNLAQDAWWVRGLEPIMSPPHYSLQEVHARWQRQLPHHPSTHAQMWVDTITAFEEELQQALRDREYEVRETLDGVERTMGKLWRLFVAREPWFYAEAFFSCWNVYVKQQDLVLRLLVTCSGLDEAARKKLQKEIEQCEVDLEDQWERNKLKDDPPTFFQTLSQHYSAVLDLQMDLAYGGVAVGLRQRLIAEFLVDEESEEKGFEDEEEELASLTTGLQLSDSA